MATEDFWVEKVAFAHRFLSFYNRRLEDLARNARETRTGEALEALVNQNPHIVMIPLIFLIQGVMEIVDTLVIGIFFSLVSLLAFDALIVFILSRAVILLKIDLEGERPHIFIICSCVILIIYMLQIFFGFIMCHVREFACTLTLKFLMMTFWLVVAYYVEPLVVWGVTRAEEARTIWERARNFRKE